MTTYFLLREPCYHGQHIIQRIASMERIARSTARRSRTKTHKFRCRRRQRPDPDCLTPHPPPPRASCKKASQQNNKNRTTTNYSHFNNKDNADPRSGLCPSSKVVWDASREKGDGTRSREAPKACRATPWRGHLDVWIFGARALLTCDAQECLF